MFASRYRAALRRERLRSMFIGTQCFGAGWHRFKRGKPCSRKDVSEFEARARVSLPADFKAVLTEVGNGCPGPYYGLSPLQAWSQPWEVTELREALLARPFDPTAPREHGLCPGALRICNAGCEHYVLLIVSGPHSGEVWHDTNEDLLGTFPVSDSSGQTLSFTAWIDGWLNALPSGDLEEGFWTSYGFDGHAVAQVVLSTTKPLTTIATDQLPCPACVHRIGKLSTFPRVVVPTPRSFPSGWMNPKQAAILGAKGELAVEPRQILPWRPSLVV